MKAWPAPDRAGASIQQVHQLQRHYLNVQKVVRRTLSEEQDDIRLEAAKASVPRRLNLQYVDASNMGKAAQSQISMGYTLEEIRSGVKTLTALETLEQWQPVNPRSVALSLCLHIGWEDNIGSDYFYLSVVTDDLRPHFPRSKAKVYVHTFDWDSLLLSILKIIKKCERDTWDASVDELRKRFAWEYEGMAGT
jgi:hypothetical protein